MINANELRIGNWIFSDDTKQPYQLTAYGIITAERIPENRSPIPLTSEILIACGFAKGIDNKWRNWNNDLDYIYGSNGFYAPNVLPEIKYLHQLQNLFHSLTGNELDIKL